MSYYHSIVTMALLYRFPHISRYWSKIAKCIYRTRV